jgi:hypothetical protein
MRKFDAEAGSDAMRGFESRSSVKLTVEVLSRSGSYARADAGFTAAALVSLAVFVFIPLTVRASTVLLAFVSPGSPSRGAATRFADFSRHGESIE